MGTQRLFSVKLDSLIRDHLTELPKKLDYTEILYCHNRLTRTDSGQLIREGPIFNRDYKRDDQ